MEWLKDKKNLPYVIGLAVFILLAAGGAIAFELGAFSGSSSPAPVANTPAVPGAAPPSIAGRPGGPAYPSGAPPAPGFPGTPGTPGRPGPAPSAVVAAAVKPASADPTKGPDPFSLPGGAKKALSGKQLASGFQNGKPPLSQILPPLNLFTLRPPIPPTAPTPPSQFAQGPAPRLSGIVNGSDGNINAILDLGGQTQTVKPGDSLPDGSRVLTIQSTSVTLRSPGGATLLLPLSGGSPDQTAPPGQPNGPPGYVPGGSNGSPPGYSGPLQDPNAGG